ncbi:MAG: FMN-binding protein [Candidatus Cryosericum sp.]
MKRFLKVVLIVVVALVVFVYAAQATYGPALKKAAAQVTIAPLDLTGVADGTYTGSAAIMHVKPEVSVTVAGERITSITYSNSVVSGAQPMVDRIIAAQSLDVDGITGATITTKAMLAAVSNAVTP